MCFSTNKLEQWYVRHNNLLLPKHVTFELEAVNW